MIIDFFKNIFSQNNKTEGIEVKHLTNSNVFISQNATNKEIVDISSLLKNNPYNDIVIDNPQFYNGSVAKLSKNISKRETTIERIIKDFGDKIWLNIHGGYDTGKSQLSLLLCEKFHNYLNYSFKDLSSNEFKNVIVLVYNDILNKQFEDDNDKIIILDDLPLLGLDDNINKLLVQLLNYCVVKKIKILSTSNFKISNKIKNLIEDTFIELDVPLLNKEEIQDIIATYTTEAKSLSYATVIEAISAGYPVYVQIICKYLNKKKWAIPLDEFSDFLLGRTFNELNEETYRKLLHTTQNESTRDILYRLNLVSGTISNEIIEIVSNIKPKISSPYEKINVLSGTWLQKNIDDTYFISPLIKNLGCNNVLPKTRKEINNKLAENILSKKNLSQYDSQRAMNYFLAGESYDQAGMIMVMALQAYFKNPDFFTETLFGSFWISTNLPNQMNSVTKTAIRLLQLYIFNDLQFKKHKKYEFDSKGFIRADLERIIEESSDIPSQISSVAVLILFKSYLLDDVKKALLHFEAIIEMGFEDFEERDPGVYNNFWMILEKITDDDEIGSWFNSYKKIGKEETFFDGEMVHLFSRRLFDNLLESEESLEDKIVRIDYIEKQASNNNMQLLGAYAVKTKIYILSEKQNKLPDAEKYYEDIKDKYVNSEAFFLITDELGRQQFYKDKKEDALLKLLKIEEINISVVTKLDTYVTIAKIYGEKDKVEAHEYTRKALDFAKNDLKVSKLTIAKLIGEYSISYWFLENAKKAIYEMAECYELLLLAYKEIDTFDTIDDYNFIVMQIGNILNYIYQILRYGKPPEISPDGNSYVAPFRGMFSNNYDPVLLKEWYYDERKYMNVYMLMNCFEFYNDKENSIKWANVGFEIDKEIVLYNFKNTLRSFVCYKILQGQYKQSIEVEKMLRDYEENLNIDISDELNVTQQKQMFLEMLERLPLRKDFASDEYYLSFNLIPIILKELISILENENTLEQCVKNIKEHLVESAFLYTENEDIENVNYFLDNFSGNYTICKGLIKWVNELDSVNKRSIQVICYLFCSLYAPSDDALKLHLGLMPFLEKIIKGVSKGTHTFILLHFVTRFWTDRINTRPQDFYFMDRWHDNLEKSNKVMNDNKVIAFYSLVCIHFDYELSAQEKEWLGESLGYIKNS